MNMKTAASRSGLSARAIRFYIDSGLLSPEEFISLISHAVTVVPMLAPMMTLMDCDSFIMPELTKPTTMTVVAEEL